MGAGTDATRRGLLLLGLVLPSCKECDELPPEPAAAGDAGSPRMLTGRFVDRSVIELAFSESLAPVDDVDPAKFRLSIARVYSGRDYGGCFAYTYYCDLTAGLSAYGCAYCLGQGCVATTTVTELALAEDDEARLRLTIDPPVNPSRCTELREAPAGSGVQLHYASGDGPEVSDLDGNALEDLGAPWARTHLAQDRRDGLFPDRDELAQIPCPGGA